MENARGPRLSSESVADKIPGHVNAQKSGRTLELGFGRLTVLALPLVAIGSIQPSWARAAVIDNAFSPGSVVDYPVCGKFAWAAREFAVYIAGNTGSIINYRERFRAGERISPLSKRR